MNVILKPKLSNDLQLCIRPLMENIFELVKHNYKKITSIVIQYNSGNIYVGSTGINKGDQKKYYSSEELSNDDITTFIQNNNVKNILEDLYISIINDKLSEFYKSKIKSFNVIYKAKDNKVLVCTNSIGSKSMGNSLIYEEF